MFKALFDGWSLLSELSQQRSAGTAGAVLVNKPSPQTLDPKYMEHLVNTLLGGVVVSVTSAKDGSAGYVLSEKTACDQRTNILFSMISTMVLKQNQQDQFASNQDMLAIAKLYQDFATEKQAAAQQPAPAPAPAPQQQQPAPAPAKQQQQQQQQPAAAPAKQQPQKEKKKWSEMGDTPVPAAPTPTTDAKKSKEKEEREKIVKIMAEIEECYAMDNRLNERYRRFTDEQLCILQGHTSISGLPHRQEHWNKIRKWYFAAQTECRHGAECFNAAKNSTNPCPYIHPHQPQPFY